MCSNVKVSIELPEKLVPVFKHPACDVRGAYGGRGSAKTRSFATMTAVWGWRFGKAGASGQILCARQFMNSLDDSSLEEVKRAIEGIPWLMDYYEIGDRYVKSKDGLIWYSFAGLDRNISSIKSKGRILLCWVDEAEQVSEAAWEILIPTLREEGKNWSTELWVTWNPARKGSATDKRFRNNIDSRYQVVELNWRDNKRFPEKLERDRQRDLQERPDQYEHIWEGDYVSVSSGAYYARQLQAVKNEGRIGIIAPDPLLTIRAYFDIGGTGAKADAVAVWIVQFVGLQIRLLNYYEQQGQPLATHIQWMRDNGYGNAEIVLPHDGRQQDKVYDVSYESELLKAGFSVRVIDNQGKGAAFQRVEAARRLFPQMWFDTKCQAGIDAIGWYHEKIDPIRNIGLGPEHDWSSHAADAFGLVAVSYEMIQAEKTNAKQRKSFFQYAGTSSSWMGA